LDVLGYMASAVRGDVAAVADASFDCILCGLCTARCPAELVPANVALLARRLYGKYLAPKAGHLSQRLDELAQGKFQPEVHELKSLSCGDLKARYEARDIEP
jgi:ferredoxin